MEHGTENKLSGNGKGMHFITFVSDCSLPCLMLKEDFNIIELNHKDINSPNELSDAAAAAKVLDDVPVDEDLFTEDLDDLDDDMDME